LLWRSLDDNPHSNLCRSAILDPLVPSVFTPELLLRVKWSRKLKNSGQREGNRVLAVERSPPWCLSFQRLRSARLPVLEKLNESRVSKGNTKKARLARVELCRVFGCFPNWSTTPWTQRFAPQLSHCVGAFQGKLLACAFARSSRQFAGFDVFSGVLASAAQSLQEARH